MFETGYARFLYYFLLLVNLVCVMSFAYVLGTKPNPKKVFLTRGVVACASR